MNVRPGYWSRLADMLAAGDWIYRDAHYLVADMDVDGDVARRWVPPPLRLSAPARASIFTAWFPQTTSSAPSTGRPASFFMSSTGESPRSSHPG